jgi:site-specific DNA recombinase
MGAARRKGKWVGGAPLLGYDVINSKLVLNQAEAARVSTIFDLYLGHQGLLPTVDDLDRRGWRTKAWTTRRGKPRGGLKFTKTSLHQLLINPAYKGEIAFRGSLYPGEHPAIVDPAVFDAVQRLLARHRRLPRETPQRAGAVLQGLLFCQACNRAMTPAHCWNRTRRYHYYVCTRAQKEGWAKCARPSVPAGRMEALVIERVRELASRQVPELGTVWGTLAPRDRQEIVRSVLRRVDYHGERDDVSINVDLEEMPALVRDVLSRRLGTLQVGDLV